MGNCGITSVFIVCIPLSLCVQGSFGFFQKGNWAKATEDNILQVNTTLLMTVSVESNIIHEHASK